MIKLPNDDTGRALHNVQLDGSDLTKPMEMDFFVAVPSKEAGEKVAIEVEKHGFNVSLEQDDEFKEWTCYCSSTLIPEYNEVVRIERELDTIAKKYGGYSDGFGTYGNS